MKKKLLMLTMLTIGAVTYLTSCSKITDAISKAISGQAIEFETTISPITDTTTQTLGGANVSFNVDSIIKAATDNVLSASNITSIKLNVCTLTITDGIDSANNFANFQDASLSLTATGVAPVVAASVTNNPDQYSSSLTLPPDANQELKPFFTGTSFTYSLSGKLRRATTHSITVKVHLEVTLNVHG